MGFTVEDLALYQVLASNGLVVNTLPIQNNDALKD
jgi:hypothetical protein